LGAPYVNISRDEAIEAVRTRAAETSTDKIVIRDSVVSAESWLTWSVIEVERYIERHARAVFWGDGPQLVIAGNGGYIYVDVTPKNVSPAAPVSSSAEGVLPMAID
jgi:hypothetical protein